MNNNCLWQRKDSAKNVVKRGREMIFAQVIENAAKIYSKKCPILPMQYDIISL